MKKRLYGLMTAILFLVWMGQPVYAETKQVSENFRAVWVSSVINLDFPSKKGLSSQEMKQEIDVILNRTAELGLNAVVLQVRPCADALYPSVVFPWSEYLTGEQGKAPDSEFDPLAYWLESAHRRNIAVHAWINPYRITHTTAKITSIDQLAPSHPARLNPELAILYENALYFDPGHPESMNVILNGIEEILVSYDIDGIHLDDYFYPGVDFPDSASWAQWGEGVDRDVWRRENVNRLIQRIQEKIQEIKPEVRFGVSPFAIWQNASSDPLGSDTRGAESYRTMYADTRKWVKEGWLDYICPQIYWYIGFDIADYSRLLLWWMDVCRDTDVDLYIGHAVYKEYEGQSGWSGEIVRQLELNQSMGGVSGSVFFRFSHLTGSLGEQIRQFYASSALTVPLELER